MFGSFVLPEQITAPPSGAVFTYAYTPLDDKRAWLDYPAFEAPLSRSQIADVQRDIDAIIGQTRDNQSIAKLVWNGDVNFWKKIHNRWTAEGQVFGEPHRRPWVLFKTITDVNGKYIRDAFPPRWLILTRIEPEQFRATYARDSKIFHPTLRKWVQLLPSEPPPFMYRYYMLIADHTGICCQEAAKNDVQCTGRYAHPRACIPLLQGDRKGMENDGIWGKATPFDSINEITARMRESNVNNYIDQQIEEYEAALARKIEESPLADIDPFTGARIGTEKQAKEIVKEGHKRAVDQLEQDLKSKIADR